MKMMTSFHLGETEVRAGTLCFFEVSTDNAFPDIWVRSTFGRKRVSQDILYEAMASGLADKMISATCLVVHMDRIDCVFASMPWSTTDMEADPIPLNAPVLDLGGDTTDGPENTERSDDPSEFVEVQVSNVEKASQPGKLIVSWRNVETDVVRKECQAGWPPYERAKDAIGQYEVIAVSRWNAMMLSPEERWHAVRTGC